MDETVPSLFRCSKCNETKPFDEFPPSKAKNKGQWCRRCLREDQRRIKGLSATERIVQCVHCGTSFGTTYTKAMFCSVECKRLERYVPIAAEILAAKPVTRQCVHCGANMPQAMRADAKFCSETCSSRAHAITRKMHRRIGLAGRKKGAPLLERNYIAERDKFRCGICGGKVDMKLQHPDPLFGSIDHIVPLSRGGTNDLANLQLAHLRCNLSKNDRGGAEQLRLIG
jgi:5-methylcytosine-specific restriction endonuclease McrA